MAGEYFWGHRFAGEYSPVIHDQTNIAGEYSLAMASLGHRYLATNYYVRTSSSHYQLDDWGTWSVYVWVGGCIGAAAG